MVRPVTLAQRKIALAAMAKRMDAVVNTPIPVKASFTATALDPKRMHKKAVNRPAASEISWFAGCISVIGPRSLKPVWLFRNSIAKNIISLPLKAIAIQGFRVQVSGAALSVSETSWNDE
jgi:hypothetical protein